jgi:serine/threonine protein phosphatase 1
MNRKLVVGDIHGRIEALREVLRRSRFDYETDKLIILGDVCDGGYNTYEVVEELLKIKNKIFILGNHDEWFMNHIKSGWAEEIWLQQGGANTLRSYGAYVLESDYCSERSRINTGDMNIPITHQDFFNAAKLHHTEDGMLFVHGGINPHKPLEKHTKEELLWDREIIERCMNGLSVRKHGYEKIFIGHTTTQAINKGTDPLILNGLYCLDTGAGWNGRLTIMDIHTDEYWQSKPQNPAGR